MRAARTTVQQLRTTWEAGAGTFKPAPLSTEAPSDDGTALGGPNQEDAP